MPLQRRLPAVAGGPSPLAADAEPLAEQYPNVAERMTEQAFADGTPRKVDTCLIFAADGAWKVCLRDREDGVCLWVTAVSLLDVLDVLEAALKDPHAVWRADRAAGAPEASRQKPRK